MSFIDDEFLDIQKLKDERHKIYGILDELRQICVGFNILMNDKSEERWELMKKSYYERLKEIFLYEKDLATRKSQETPPTVQ